MLATFKNTEVEWWAMRNRIFIGFIRCERCSGHASVFEHDPRAHGDLRVECPCGFWCDLWNEPEEIKRNRSSLEFRLLD